MIKTKTDLRHYLVEDLKWHGGKCPSFKDYVFNSEWWHIWGYIKSLRYYEYYENNKTRGLWFKCMWYWRKLKHHRLSTRLNIRIWPNTIGPGLYIPHLGTIFISSHAQIGSNFIIRPGCVIGDVRNTHAGHAVIGDNVELSLGVKMFGNVRIGRECIINGNAVVTGKVPPYSIVLGNPGKVVGFKMEPGEIIEYEKVQYEERDRLCSEVLERNYQKYYESRRKQILELLR